MVRAVRRPPDLVEERVVRTRVREARAALGEDLGRARRADDVIAESARPVAGVAREVAAAAEENGLRQLPTRLARGPVRLEVHGVELEPNLFGGAFVRDPDAHR